MKNSNTIREYRDKLNSQREFKRKKDTYCVYKKCKNYKLRNKNLCRPHEKKIVNQSKIVYMKMLVTTVITLLSIYFMYNFHLMHQGNFGLYYDTGSKYVYENVQKLMKYSMYIFSNVDMYIYNTFSKFNMCSILTDVQDESFVTENTICYILIHIRDKFENIIY